MHLGGVAIMQDTDRSALTDTPLTGQASTILRPLCNGQAVQAQTSKPISLNCLDDVKTLVELLSTRDMKRSDGRAACLPRQSGSGRLLRPAGLLNVH
jgi:hypothetical protein